MPYSKDHKSRTRQRILETAARLFVQQGYSATSIDQIMQACDLTRGGFYAHFATKSLLYKEAMRVADSTALAGESVSSIDALIDSYLDDAIAQSDDSPLAFLVTDLASRDQQVRDACTDVHRSLGSAVRRNASRRSHCTEESALSITAMIIGALTIARTSNDADLRSRVIFSCKKNARMLLAQPASGFFWSPKDV